MYNGKSYIENLHYSIDDIKLKRKYVYNQLISTSENIKNGIIKKVSVNDLYLLFKLYDGTFLQNYFKDNLYGKLEFSLSKRMTSSAGKTIYPRNIRSLPLNQVKFEIRMAVNFFFKFYETKGDKIVNGIISIDALEALQLVFEHEICHLLELTMYRQSSCSGKRFKGIANSIFGHTKSYHELPTANQIAKNKYNAAIGKKVTFKHNDLNISGIITNINKRATIMVLNNKGNYVDNFGNRYIKYYVPLNMIL
ncbi:MAG: hypothetical protein K0R54_461 [Clostridiaceae bacterium]|jgi:predicted SprT family Zn-dependent metalloprotease|nr:hypothetical protein [Clostridiaceae bacterium]